MDNNRLFKLGLLFGTICIILSCQKKAQSSSTLEQDSPRLLAYYTYWKSEYRADKIPYNKLNFICHAFIRPQADGSLWVPETYIEPELISNAHAAEVKVLASIGGASGGEKFSAIASDPVLRDTFANNLESFLRTHGYDGVDIDWEFPQNATDRANQNLLIEAIRTKFNSSPQPAPLWLISMAVASGNWYGQWNDYNTLNEYVDFYNLMTYDFHGSWSDHSGHNSPLYRGNDFEMEGNVQAALHYTLNITPTVPPDKINVGIPFYGRNFTTTEELYDSCPGNCSTIDYNYNEIVPLIDNGWTEHWDSASQVPYLTNDMGTGMLTYDNPRSVQLKARYALEMNTGGVFVWALGADYIAGTGQPLIDALYDACSKSNRIYLPSILKKMPLIPLT